MRARLLHHDSDWESECGTSDHSGMCLLIWLFAHHLLFFCAKMESQANLFAKISLLPILIVDLVSSINPFYASQLLRNFNGLLEVKLSLMWLHLCYVLQAWKSSTTWGYRVISTFMTILEYNKSTTVVTHSKKFTMLIKTYGTYQIFVQIAFLCFFITQALH